MLFKFKSQVTSDLIMLEDDARRLLKIMLGDDPAKGIILVQDLPAAIAKLESAVAQDEAARLQRSQEAQKPGSGYLSDPAKDLTEGMVDPVRLAQRASPMVKLLKHCVADPSDLVWGV
ncbi:acetyltransferase [Limnohabitans sp. 2KL-1]|jgi:hypothetical protein|uniref:DUF1840 domain-containing protein n=1 Tax=Limnohabitans sp. 2KL-1 TaxID=1100699 RepID=UPI000D3C5757|nr:DUF1840 domain-containing protein [Limnohabitans sp. 2KL-1]PUE47420.1 acetyltransferase [Limnohabitans sp. 2KL-1]